MEHTWSTLIERAKSNDQDAFYELYQSSYDAVYRAVKSMVRDDDAALDIVQDAFVKGFGNLSALDHPDSFLPWMKRIATNKAKDWFKKKHEISFSQMSDEEGDEPDFEEDRLEHLPEAVLDRNETERLIEEILGTLSDEQRIAIGMYYYQDMSVSEIAQELGISENTVKSRLNYGRKKIKTSVEELEKKGTKLYALAPIPFLIWLFKSQMLQPSTGNAPAATFGNIMTETIVQGTAADALSTASTGAAAVQGGTVTTAQGAEGAATLSGAASSTAAVQTAGGTAAAPSSAVAKNATKGLLSSVGTKIAAGVLSVAVIGGGIGTGVYLINQDHDSEVPVISEMTPLNEEQSKMTPNPSESEAPDEDDHVDSNLNEPETFDPFDGLVLTYDGVSGSGTVSIDSENTKMPHLQFTASETEGLSNGQTITITVVGEQTEEEIRNSCLEQGLTPIAYEQEYIVEGLLWHTQALDEIPDAVLTSIMKNAGIMLRDRDNEGFYTTIHGGWNAISHKNFRIDALDLIDAYFMTNTTNEGVENQLVLIYQEDVYYEWNLLGSLEAKHNDRYYNYVIFSNVILSNDKSEILVDLGEYTLCENVIDNGIRSNDLTYFYGYHTADEIYQHLVKSMDYKYIIEKLDISAYT